MKVKPKCANIPLLLKKLVDNVDNIPLRRKDGYAYTKRSLELMQDGHTGTVIFDKAGDIAGAAAYYERNGKIIVETLGSIGDFDGKTSPGASLLYDIFKEANGKDIKLRSLPGKTANFYTNFEFKGTATDALNMTAKSDSYIKVMKWYEDATGISKKSTDTTVLTGKVRDMFLNKKHTDTYVKEKEHYMAMFQELKDAGKDGPAALRSRRAKFKKELSAALRPGGSWQNNANSKGPMGMKLKASQMEKFDYTTAVMEHADDAFKGYTKMSDKAYIQLRAVNQAYMDTFMDSDSIKLYRGTDGDEGKSLAGAFRKLKSDAVDIQESALSGYSASEDIANNFGVLVDGITISKTVNTKDIVMHTDILNILAGQKSNRAFAKELEYIVKSGTQNIALKDIHLIENATEEIKDDYVEGMLYKLLLRDYDPFGEKGTGITSTDSKDAPKEWMDKTMKVLNKNIGR